MFIKIVVVVGSAIIVSGAAMVPANVGGGSPIRGGPHIDPLTESEPALLK